MSTELKKLDKDLGEAVENFRLQMHFDLEVFEQSHPNEYLTKDDLEEIGRQVFYCFSDIKNRIIDYLEAMERNK